MFALLRERREEALKHISDYNPFVNGTKSSLYEKVKVRTPHQPTRSRARAHLRAKIIRSDLSRSGLCMHGLRSW
jgi:hypothetical protein